MMKTKLRPVHIVSQDCQPSGHQATATIVQVNGCPTPSARILALALLSKVGPFGTLLLEPW